MDCGLLGHPGPPVILSVSTTVVEHVAVLLQPMVACTAREMTLTLLTALVDYAEVSFVNIGINKMP